MLPVSSCIEHWLAVLRVVCLNASLNYMLLLLSHIGPMCPPAKRVRDATTLPGAIVKQLVQYIPHNTYLYLYKTDREPVCCQQSLFGVCRQCDAVCRHAAKMWQCLRKIRLPGHDEAGRSLSDHVVNGILELHLHMQYDMDYEPIYFGDSISQAHIARAAWEAQLSQRITSQIQREYDCQAFAGCQ
jgi:hypothetical protein